MNRFEQFNLFVDSDKINGDEMRFLMTIHRYHNHEKGYSFPSIEKIMNGMKIKNRKSFYKIKQSLEKKGILITTMIKGIGNQYKINYQLLVDSDNETVTDNLVTVGNHDTDNIITNSNCNPVTEMHNPVTDTVLPQLQTVTTKRKEKEKLKKEKIKVNNNTHTHAHEENVYRVTKDHEYYDYLNGDWMNEDISEENLMKFNQMREERATRYEYDEQELMTKIYKFVTETVNKTLTNVFSNKNFISQII